MKKILLLILPCFTYAISPSITAIEQAMNQGNIGQVEQMSKLAVAEHPNSATAHYFLGQAYLNENKFNLSYAELSKAQELDPTLKFTQKPEAFKDMLIRSKKSNISSAPEKTSPPKANKNPGSTDSDWLQNCLIALGVILGSMYGLYSLNKIRRKNNEINDYNPDFYLDDELDKQSSNLTQRTENSVTLKEKTQESLNYKKEPWNLQTRHVLNYSDARSTTGYIQQINKDASTNSDFLTGVTIGNLLSNSGTHETIINNNETMVNDAHLNDLSSGDNLCNASSSNNPNSRINSDNLGVFDSSVPSDSWSDSSDSSLPFDSSSDSNNW